MKRIVVLSVLVILIVLGFAGCSDGGAGSSTQYYYDEAFTIEIVDFNTVPLPSEATFSAIKSYRDALRVHMVDFLGSSTDTTESEIYTTLTQAGMTPTEANNEISFLNQVGNNIGIFTHATDSSLYVIIYVEKI